MTSSCVCTGGSLNTCDSALKTGEHSQDASGNIIASDHSGGQFRDKEEFKTKTLMSGMVKYNSPLTV